MERYNNEIQRNLMICTLSFFSALCFIFTNRTTIGIAQANLVKFHGIRPQMYIE